MESGDLEHFEALTDQVRNEMEKTVGLGIRLSREIRSLSVILKWELE